ncbi:MAG: hypothetical protein ACJA00_002589 [Myxococcota bacterium]|jgi:hypothetical protein
MRTLTVLPLLALVACDELIPLDPDLDGPDNTISGAVVISFPGEPATAIILAGRADNPLPPNGTGRPVTLTTVPATDFSQANGVQSADYAMNGLPDGDWLLSGLIDIDGDFHPNIDALAGATCGDIVGGHIVSLTDTTFAAISVDGGNEATGITVTLASTLPVERPAFFPLTATGAPGIPVVDRARAAEPQGFALQTTGIHAALRRPDGTPSITYDLEGPYTVDPASPAEGNPFGLAPSSVYDVFSPSCDTAFFAQFLDDDGDGIPDPHPSVPGVFNSWPQIGLTWVGVPVDTTGDGAPDSFSREGRESESWSALSVLSPLLLQAGVPVGIPVLLSQLPVVWVPAAQRSSASTEDDCTGTWVSGVCTDLITTPADLPAGAWAITVIESTGQTWTVPNTLATSSSTDAAGFLPALQGSFLLVE